MGYSIVTSAGKFESTEEPVLQDDGYWFAQLADGWIKISKVHVVSVVYSEGTDNG